MTKVILNGFKSQGEKVITEEQDGLKAEMTATEQHHLKNLFEKVSSTSAGSVPGDHFFFKISFDRVLDVTLYATSDHGSKPEVLSQTAQASAPLTKLKQIRRGNGLYLLSKVKVMLSLFKYICLAVNHVDFVNSRVREKNQPLQLCTARTAWSDSVTKEEELERQYHQRQRVGRDGLC